MGTKKKSGKNPAHKSVHKQPQNGLVPVTVKTHHDKKGGHPHVIVENIDDKHVSVGITHDKYKGKNHPNYALTRNPLGGKEQSYMRRQGTVAPQKDYSGKRNGTMTPKDFAQAVIYGERAKQKYLDGKKDKKKVTTCQTCNAISPISKEIVVTAISIAPLNRFVNGFSSERS